MSRFDVFLSHSNRDKSIVERIAERLKRAGLEPWLDKWSLTPGGDWQDELGRGVEAAEACAVFVGPGDLGAWELQELALALNRAAQDRDFRVFAVLLPGVEEPFDPTVLPHFLRTRTWVDFRRGYEHQRALEDLIAAVKGLPFGPSAPVEPRSGVTPYRGLQPFGEEDAELFFGRDREVQRLVEMLKATRFLAVIGPSGSGKSSLVRAGLIPALRAGSLSGVTGWTICVVRPGADPIGALAARLVSLDGGEGMHATLDALGDDPRTLHLASVLTLASRPHGERVLWIVDQLEEMFTLTNDERARTSFFENLLFASSAAGGPSTVVVTMRADFYARTAAYPDLAEQVAAHQFLVGPMDRNDLRQVIEEPARLAGAQLESGLVDTIVDEVVSQPGALPLLEHALLELWERRRGNMLTLEGHRDSGGVPGALAARAEAIYDGFDPQGKAVVQRILLRLTQPGDGTEDTRRRASMSELVTGPERAEHVEGVVAELASARMLTVTGGKSAERWVDVSHEALVRGWERLRGWVEEDRAGLRVHRRLTEAAQEWQRLGHEEALLYRGALLTEASEWRTGREAGINDLERAFLDASVERQARQRRAARRRRQLTVGGLLVVIVIIGAFAVVAAREARVAADQRDAALSRELAANSAAELSLDPELSLLLAIAALEKDRTPEAAEALRDAILESHVRFVLRGHQGPVTVARFDSRARLLVTASEDGSARIWNARSGRLNRRLVHTRKDPSGLGVKDARFSRDGSLLVTTSAFEPARVWHVRTGRLLRTIRGGRAAVVDTFTSGERVLVADAAGRATLRDARTGRKISEWRWSRRGNRLWEDVEISPDGRWVVAQLEGEPARLWNAKTGRRMRDLGPASSLSLGSDHDSFAFSSDSRLLLRSGPGRTSLWRTATARRVRIYPQAGEVTDAAFSLDGRRFVAMSGQTAEVWKVFSGRRVAEMRDPAGTSEAAFSPDGLLLVTASHDGVGRIWETSTGRRLAELRGHSGGVAGAAFSPRGEWVATASSDGTARLWLARFAREPRVLRHRAAVWSAVFGPDGNTLLTGSADGKARLWNLTSGRHREFALGDEVFDVQFRDNGRLVFGEGTGRAALWDAASGKSVRRFKGTPLVEVAISPDGRQAVTVGAGIARSHALARGVPQAQIRYGRADASTDEPTVSFSRDGHAVLITTGSKAIVWDPRTGRQIAVREHKGVQDGVFSPDGRRVATVSFESASELWYARDGNRIRRLVEGGIGLSGIAFSPDGSRLVGTSGDGPAHIWDGVTGRHLAELRHTVQSDSDVAFSGDSQWLATVNKGGAHIWDAATGRSALGVIHRFRALRSHALPGREMASVDKVAFSSNGLWLITGARNGTVQLHQCEICRPPDELLQIARSRVTRAFSDAERRRYLRG